MGKSMKREYLLEILAELEHKQWAAWSRDIAIKEKLSEGCIQRWQSFWVPYSELDENIKDSDRKYANIILDRLEVEKIVEFEK
jgi:hypothetical protein